MAGEARSTNFMLGTATVMLGKMADLFKLNPTAHSLGLVKNFVLSGEPSFTDLTQGVRNTKVFSVKTGNNLMASAEVYEMTSRNLAYGLGLEGYNNAFDAPTVGTTLSAAATANATALTVASVTGFTAGDTVLIQDGINDKVHVDKIDSTALGTLNLVHGLPEAYGLGATIKLANVLELGSQNEDEFYSAYVVGKIADGTTVAIQLPKVRITKGFSFAFRTDNYQNIPLELSVYDLLPEDAMFTEFSSVSGGNYSGRIITLT